jgi:hypothetical protein
MCRACLQAATCSTIQVSAIDICVPVLLGRARTNFNILELVAIIPDNARTILDAAAEGRREVLSTLPTLKAHLLYYSTLKDMVCIQ